MTGSALARVPDEPRALTTPAAAPAAALPAMSFDEMLAMGEHLVSTGFLPKHIRNGAQCAAIVLAGRELGMQPMQAIRSLALVEGKVVEDAGSQLARFKRAGGRAVFHELTDEGVVLALRHPNGDEHTETFTMEDAKRAGLASKAVWRSYPKAMLRSRAITAGLKSLGWEGAVGAYSPDEAEEISGEWKPTPVVPTPPTPRATPAPVPPSLEEALEMPAPGRWGGSDNKTLAQLAPSALQALLDWVAKLESPKPATLRVRDAAQLVLAWRKEEARREEEATRQAPAEGAAMTGAVQTGAPETDDDSDDDETLLPF